MKIVVFDKYLFKSFAVENHGDISNSETSVFTSTRRWDSKWNSKWNSLDLNFKNRSPSH